MSDQELPGMWEASIFTGGADEVRPRAEKIPHPSGDDGGDGQAWDRRLPLVSPEAAALENAASVDMTLSPENLATATNRRLPVRMADAAQYAREAIPEDQRGQIRVRLLNATPDPLGSVAALCAQYQGRVIRNLSEVTDAERQACLDDMGKTVLNGPLEAAQFHWQIEGVTRSITHQMVRSRASFFAQESLRFAVPEGNWADEVPLPPSIAGVARHEGTGKFGWEGIAPDPTPQQRMRMEWEEAMAEMQGRYARLIELGMPAEEARGVLPHDMPTRIHWVMDLRTLLAEAGKRTCTQAQFPWRLIFAGMSTALREYRSPNQSGDYWGGAGFDHWQFQAIADRLRPVCFQTGQCGFMAKFDRSCSIRSRVDAFAAAGIEPSEWGKPVIGCGGGAAECDGTEGCSKPVEVIKPIYDWEWAADPSAARS